MGLLDRLLRIDTDTPPTTDIRSVAAVNPATLTTNYLTGVSPLLIADQPTQALAQPTVFASVRMIASSVQSMPWRSMMIATREVAAAQPAVIRQPDPFNPREVTLKQIATTILLKGEAFVWLTAHDRSGRATVAIPIPNDEVHITWDEQRLRPVYTWRSQRMVLGETIDHMKYVDTGALHGIGPVQALSGQIAGSLQAERLSASQYTDGAWVDGVLEAPNKLTIKEAERLRAQWDAAHAGKRGTAVLEGGIEYKPVMMTNTEAQLIEGRGFTATELARAFGIPAPLLGLPMGEGSSLTYQNIEGVKSQFAQFAVQPVTDVIEASFTKLVPTTQTVLFQFAALLRADIATRYSVYDRALTAGILTPNEVRAMEGLPDMPGGDTLKAEPEPVAEANPTPAQQEAINA